MSQHIVPVKNYVAVFIALLILTGLTTTVSYIDLGHTRIGKTHVIDWDTVAALTIAVVKTLLVVLFFMHVKYSPINATGNRCRFLLARHPDCFDAV